MREIKFRGLRLESDYWEYGSLYINEKGKTFIDKSDWRREPVRPETVGQYIELEDKHESGIYEGDILKTDEAGWIGYVTYGSGVFFLTDNEGGFSRMPNWEECKIIGNIYENPELLKWIYNYK